MGAVPKKGLVRPMGGQQMNSYQNLKNTLK